MASVRVANPIELCSIRTEKGRYYYVYLEVEATKYQAFKDAQAQGKLVLGEYGVALLWGEGRYPSAEVRALAEEKFGVNHELEDQIESLVVN